MTLNLFVKYNKYLFQMTNIIGIYNENAQQI